MRLGELNTASEDLAVGEFLRCCGSDRWASQMAAARPFVDEDAMMAAADRLSASLGPADWLQAFAAHPRIGASTVSGPAGGERQARWAAEEQGGAAGASGDVQQRLAAANREYERRFGYIFIVCATGKSGEDMLKMLGGRLHNNPADELMVACGEQRKITRIRLAKLVRA